MLCSVNYLLASHFEVTMNNFVPRSYPIAADVVYTQERFIVFVTENAGY